MHNAGRQGVDFYARNHQTCKDSSIMPGNNSIKSNQLAGFMVSIYGIWFYDEVECQRIAELMKNLTQLEQLKAHREVGSPISRQNKAVDIVQMLFKAEHEYNKVKQSSEPKQITTSSGLIHNSSNLIKPIPIKLTEIGTDTRYQQIQQQDKSTELGTKHLNLAALFGTQKSALTDVSNETHESKNRVSGRPAVVRSLSYEEPRRLPEHETSQTIKKQFCPAIQKLMCRGVDLHPVSELPENHLCENQSEKNMGESLVGLFHSLSSKGNVSSQQKTSDESSPLFSKSTRNLLQKLHCTQAPLPSSCPTVIQSELYFSRSQNGSKMQPISQSHAAYLSSNLEVQPKMLHVPALDKPKRTAASNNCNNQIQASGIIPPHELFQKLQIVQQEQQHHVGKMTLAAKFSAQPPPVVNQPNSSMKPFDSQTEKTISSEKQNLLFQAISPQCIPATVVPSLLMSPMVFAQSTVGKPMMGVEASAIPLPQTDTIPVPKQLNVCLHPAAQMGELINKTPNVLTKTQFQETLLYLLQNDTNFVNVIYEAYLTGQPNTAAEKKT
ncbi:mRNA-decapping enzyme 1B isoform X3 [Carcharodon carcharias]|uniref:mRNA-decapping enzyme 1B isoform X3 n=1 Tax=Carcharodon carcharias TaxID=13397 RepID=UPI001B7F7020|nr:mRNA-decapping enzyme 1B isoform X3 [Carcharodon carcharias]